MFFKFCNYHFGVTFLLWIKCVHRSDYMMQVSQHIIRKLGNHKIYRFIWEAQKMKKCGEWKKEYSKRLQKMYAVVILMTMLRRFIIKIGDRGKCDYWEKHRNVINLDTLINFLTDSLDYFYTDPANFMFHDSKEGGYQGDVSDAWDLLDGMGLRSKENQLNDDIFRSLDLSNGWAEEYGNLKDYRYENWLSFKNTVQHKSRFMFSIKQNLKFGGRNITAKQFLNELGAEIKRHKMMKVLPGGTKLFRCRQHKIRNEVTEEKHICSPEEQYAIYPNRMSPSGISMFYAGFDIKTALMETLDKLDSTKKYYTIAEFSTKKEFNVIDLTSLQQSSAFDKDNRELYYIVSFLEEFLDDFAKPIARDGREHTEYVPTQIITEYFRYEFIEKRQISIDGIVYPSSKHQGAEACVLTMDHYESLLALKFNPSLTTNKIKFVIK